MSLVAIKWEQITLKVICASNNVCVDYVVSPLGGDKCLLKNVKNAIDSFIPEIPDADWSSNESSEVLMS